MQLLRSSPSRMMQFDIYILNEIHEAARYSVGTAMLASSLNETRRKSVSTLSRLQYSVVTIKIHNWLTLSTQILSQYS